MQVRIVEIITRKLRNKHADNLALDMVKRQREVDELTAKLEQARISAKAIAPNNPFAQMAVREAAQIEERLRKAENESRQLKESLAALIQGCLQEIAPLKFYQQSVLLHGRLKELVDLSGGINEGLKGIMRESLKRTEAMVSTLQESYGPFPSHQELVRIVNQDLMRSVMERVQRREQ